MIDPRPDMPAALISELVADPDFPISAVGKLVDIKGYSGVIVEVVNNSIKVRSAENSTMSYNYHTLRRLYGPRIAPAPAPIEPAPDRSPATRPEPKREIVLEPNFDTPLVLIETLLHRPDFPGCAFGVHLDLHSFTGVVVELVGRSLKVRSREGTTLSYNADGLRKIYTKPLTSGSTVTA